MNYAEDALRLHEKHRGKLEVRSKVPLKDRNDFSLAYTPGVAAVSEAIAKNPEDVYKYTIKGNTVAIVSDGSAVLGLGNIGAAAAIPVMEGKAAIFKELAGIDAFPICLDTHDPQEIIRTVRNIAPVFGGVNLEDIKAPECFTIEAALQDLGIPLMHDDQHGTAVVVLAALTNALRVTNKDKQQVRVVINGAGSAGVAITKLLIEAGFPPAHVLLCDTKGIIYAGRPDTSGVKEELSRITNERKLTGTLHEAIKDADVFIGVSKGNLLSEQDVTSMAKDAIVFALANPVPEIMPDKARAAGAAIVASGRSDFPNQVNNSLAFPGIFRGALDARATRITTAMKLAAAQALASSITKPKTDEILPFATDKKIVPAVAAAVSKAWRA